MQILVVVAIIQIQPMKSDGEEGSMSTIVEHGLFGPEGGQRCP